VRIVDAERDEVGSVLIEAGKISEINSEKNLNPGSASKLDSLEPGFEFEKIDGTGKILMPGLFDPHVHFRDPGLTTKEDFLTGTSAAVAGGVTTVFDMPNTIPPATTVAILDEKKNILSKKALCNFGLFIAAGKNNIDELKKAENVAGIKLFLNHTTGDLKVEDTDLWRAVFNVGKRVVMHAEGKTFVQAVDIWLDEGAPCQLHLCHAGLKIEIEKVEDVRANYPEFANKIFVEVTPHHLLLTEKDVDTYGNIAKMLPPLASKEDQTALWKAVENEEIDFFGTDHAPHTLKDKDAGAFGIPGIETYFPLLFTEFVKRGWDLRKFAKMTSLNTADIFGIDNKGLIEEGYDADLILIDPEFKGKVEPEKFMSKAKWSPFEGMMIKGQIEKTFVGGSLVFSGGKIVNENICGKEVQF